MLKKSVMNLNTNYQKLTCLFEVTVTYKYIQQLVTL